MLALFLSVYHLAKFTHYFDLQLLHLITCRIIFTQLSGYFSVLVSYYRSCHIISLSLPCVLQVIIGIICCACLLGQFFQVAMLHTSCHIIFTNLTKWFVVLCWIMLSCHVSYSLPYYFHPVTGMICCSFQNRPSCQISYSLPYYLHPVTGMVCCACQIMSSCHVPYNLPYYFRPVAGMVCCACQINFLESPYYFIQTFTCDCWNDLMWLPMVNCGKLPYVFHV